MDRFIEIAKEAIPIKEPLTRISNVSQTIRTVGLLPVFCSETRGACHGRIMWLKHYALEA